MQKIMITLGSTSFLLSCLLPCLFSFLLVFSCNNQGSIRVKNRNDNSGITDNELLDPINEQDSTAPIVLSSVKRLSANKLRKSIHKLFGPGVDGKKIDWFTDSSHTKSRFLFDEFGQALGTTDDFGEITEETEDISVLFSKLMSDMSASVCKQGLDKDNQTALSNGSGGNDTKIISPNVDTSNGLLSYAELETFIIEQKLKFHGKFLSANHPEILKEIEFFENLEQNHGLENAILGLCMLHLRSPEFLTVH